jgi:hypothetical protein
MADVIHRDGRRDAGNPQNADDRVQGGVDHFGT